MIAKVILRVSVSAAIVVLALQAPARAGIINVPGDQASIQAGIDAADPGDEVVVAEGTYFENISFNGKAITLRSTDPTDPDVVANTIINGSGGGSVVTCNNSEGPETILNGFTITNGDAEQGGGMYIINSSPTVTHCTFSGNVASQYPGGGMYNLGGSPMVSNCMFIGNEATGDWPNGKGGGLASSVGSPSVSNCTFSGNTATYRGGGINLHSGSSVVSNCTFSENAALSGGAMSIGFYHATVLTLRNSVLWGNSSDEIHVIGQCSWDWGVECYETSDCPAGNICELPSVSISHSNVQGSGGSGGGNIDSNPLFVDPDGADDEVGTLDDDLRLAAGSPCIDSANNATVPVDVTTDLDGNPRLVDDPLMDDTGLGDCLIVDMGAYEYQDGPTECCGDCPTDVNDDGNTGPFDLAMLLGTWGPIEDADCLDANADGSIGPHDLAILLGAWGPCE